MEGGLSLGKNRVAGYLTSNNYYSFTSPYLMKYESLIQRFSGNYMRLSENGYFPQSRRQAQIIILEILKCIPVVIIFAFLDLGKNISFSDSLIGGPSFFMTF